MTPLQLILATLIQVSPTMYIQDNATRLLLDNQVLVVLLEVSPDGKDILPGVKSIASQLVLDCNVRGKQRLGGSIAFAENYAQGEVVVIQPGLESSKWLVFTKKSAALTTWIKACIF